MVQKVYDTKSVGYRYFPGHDLPELKPEPEEVVLIAYRTEVVFHEEVIVTPK